MEKISCKPIPMAATTTTSFVAARNLTPRRTSPSPPPETSRFFEPPHCSPYRPTTTRVFRKAEVAILCEDCDGIGPRPIEFTVDAHLAELLVRCCDQSARQSNVSHSQITMMVRRCLFKPPIFCIKDAAPEISSLILSSANT